LTLTDNFRLLDGIVSAGFVASLGFMWNLSSDLSSMSTTIERIDKSVVELKQSVEKLSDRVQSAEVQIAGIGADVKHKASKADLLELVTKK